MNKIKLIAVGDISLKTRNNKLPFEKVKKFLKEVNAELRKVTWPTKDELVGSTIVTVVVSLVVAIFIGIVDRILSVVIRSIFGGGIGG